MYLKNCFRQSLILNPYHILKWFNRSGKKKRKKQRKNFKSTIKPKLYIHISAKIALIAQLCLYCYRVMIIGPGQATQQERAAAFLAQQIGHGRTKTAGAGWCCLGQGLFHMNCAIELWGVRQWQLLPGCCWVLFQWMVRHYAASKVLVFRELYCQLDIGQQVVSDCIMCIYVFYHCICNYNCGCFLLPFFYLLFLDCILFPISSSSHFSRVS